MRKWLAVLIVTLILAVALYPTIVEAGGPATDSFTICRISYIWLWDGVTVIVLPITVCLN